MKAAAVKVCLYCIEAIAISVAFLAVALAAIVFAFSSGAISVDFARDQIETALEDALPPDYDVRIRELSLAWNGAEELLALIAEDAIVFDASGEQAFTAPRLRLRFSPRAIVRGYTGPSDIEIVGFDARLLRDSEGRFSLGLRTDETPVEEGALQLITAPDVIEEMLKQARAAFQEGRLTRVAVEGGRISYRDAVEETPTEFVAEEFFFDARRRGGDILTTYSATARVGEGEGRLTGEIAYSELSDTVFARARLRGLDTGAALEALGANYSDIHGSNIEFDFAATATGDGELVAADADVAVTAGLLEPAPWDAESALLDGLEARLVFNPETEYFSVETLRIGAGDIRVAANGRAAVLGGGSSLLSNTEFQLEFEELRGAWPGFLEGVFEVNDLSIAGRLAPESRSIILDSVEAKLGDASLNAEMTYTDAFGEDGVRLSPGVVAQASVTGRLMPEDVLRFWPVDIARGARDWIRDYLFEGLVTGGEFSMNLQPGDVQMLGYYEDDGRPILILPDEAMHLEFDFVNATVDYIPGLTPLTGGAGRGILGGNSFYVIGQSGRVGDIELVEGYVEMPKTSPKGQPAVFRGRARGSAADMMALLNMEPFGYADELGVDPRLLGGDGDVTFKFSRPLRREVDLEEIGYWADARITEFSIPNVVDDADLSDGDVAIQVRREHVKVDGEVRIAGVPATMSWKQDFFVEKEPTSIRLTGVVDASSRDALGFATRSFLNGEIGFDVSAFGDGVDMTRSEAALDLTAAQLDFTDIGWSKEIGEEARATASLSVRENGVIDLLHGALVGDGMEVAATARIGADGKLLAAAAPIFRIEGVADLALQAERDEASGALMASVTGDFLNMAPFLERPLGDSAPSDAFDWGGGLLLDLDLARVLLRNDEKLTNVLGEFEHDGAHIVALNASARYADPEKGISVRIDDGADESNARRMSLASSDAGAFLSGVLGLESIRGGDLTVTAALPPLPMQGDAAAEDETASDAPAMVFGSIEGRDLRIVDAPVLAKLLAASSLSGISNMASGEGIVFDRASIGFSKIGDVLQIENAALTGPSLGLTTSGAIDFGADEITLSGALAPAYTLNSLFALVPVAGPILVPREGEGLVAISYSLSGPTREPTIFVNPLSAATPGALRVLFQPIERTLSKINNGAAGAER